MTAARLGTRAGQIVIQRASPACSASFCPSQQSSESSERQISKLSKTNRAAQCTASGLLIKALHFTVGVELREQHKHETFMIYVQLSMFDHDVQCWLSNC